MHPDWVPVIILTVASVAGGQLGARIASRTDSRRLSTALTVLVGAVALHMAPRARPALL